MRNHRPLLLAASVFVIQACSVDLSIGGGSAVSCERNDDCPTGYQCRELRCADSTNDAPSIVIRPIPRAVGLIPLTLEVFDPEEDAVSVELAAIANGRPAISIGLFELPSSSAGLPTTVEWDSEGTFFDVSYREDLVLSASPADFNSRGPVVFSSPFVIGNDAPEVTGLYVVGTELGGDTSITLVLEDSSGDDVRVESVTLLDAVTEQEIAAANIAAGASTSFPGQALAGLSTSPEGGEHTLTWRTLVMANVRSTADLILQVGIADAFDETALGRSSPFRVSNAPAAAVVVRSTPQSRAVAHVPLEIVLQEPNGVGAGEQRVNLAIEYALDSGPWLPATILQSTVGLAVPPEPQVFAFTWDAVTDAASGPLEITSVWDGAELVDVIVPTEGVRVRVTPTDTGELGGDETISDPFSLGNLPPSIAPIPTEPVVSGDIPLGFTLSDSSSDIASVVVQFRHNPTGAAESGVPWRAAALSLGATTNLVTSADGEAHVVVWQSEADPSELPATPQGIGMARLDGVEIRFRASDQPNPDTSHVAEWVAMTPFAVENQIPPRVESVFVKGDGDYRSGAILIEYRVIDAEDPMVDVRVEFSVNDGAAWHPCREYPSDLSEGLYDLGASSTGVTHSFVWDVNANLMTQFPGVRLRMRAADDTGPGGWTEILPASLVGPLIAQPEELLSAPTTLAGNSVALGDFTSDGVIDIALTNGGIEVWSQQVDDGVPTGTFVLAQSIPAGTDKGMNLIRAWDLDGDENLDIAYILADYTIPIPEPEALHVRRGNGDGTFGDSIVITPRASDSQRDLAFGDFDADGVYDVAAANYGVNGLSIAYGGNDGAGHWDETFTGLSDHGSGLQAWAVGIGDFDGDDVDDVALATRGGNPTGVYVYRSNGDRSFAPVVFVEAHAVSHQIYDLLVADLNADGKDDLVARTFGEGIRVGLATSTGTVPSFAAWQDYAAPATQGRLVRADVNGDGLEDIVSIDLHQMSFLIAQGLGVPNGAFVPGPVIPTTMNTNPTHAVAADLDGDTVVDLAASSETVMMVWMGRVDTEMTPNTFLPRSGADLRAELVGVAAADLNGDGILDLAFAAFARQQIGVALGTGRQGRARGSFGTATYFDVTDTPRYLTVADFDGDGISDIAVGVSTFNGSYADQVEVLLGRGEGGVGDGSFEWVTVLSDGAFTNKLFSGDFDGDGLADLITSTDVNPITAPPDPPPPDLLLLRSQGSDGSGGVTFEAAVVIADGHTGLTMAAADVDQDGDLDLVGGSDRISIHEADGAGSFAAGFEEDAPDGAAGWGMVVADIDGDGLSDVVTANSQLTFQPGEGTLGALGAFDSGAEETWASTKPPRFLAGGDYNGDGIIDLAMATRVGASFWMGVGADGLGLADFTESIVVDWDADNVILPATELQIASGDINSDGTTDLIIAGRRAKDVVIFAHRRERYREGWSHPLGTRVVAVGDVAPTALDRFGVPRSTLIGMRPFFTETSLGPVDARGGDYARAVDFRDMLRRSPLGPPAAGAGVGRLRPLTRAWVVSGDLRLTEVTTAGGMKRVRLDQRLGPVCQDASCGEVGYRGGLSLETGAPRLVIELPLLPAHHDTAINAGTVRVYGLVDCWTKASELPADPTSDTSTPAAYLPLVSTRAVLLRHDCDWVEVIDGGDAFTNDGQPSFVLDTAAGSRQIRIQTGRLGLLQGFLEE